MPMGIAARSMAWDRQMRNTGGPLGSSGDDGTREPVKVEAWLNGAWTDITSYVMVRDNSGNISITRGHRDEGTSVEQATCHLTLNNRDGRWSPRNPSGPYYGSIGRNTPLRVYVPDGLGGRSYRFQGEVSVWPQSWDTTGTDVWTEVEAAGIIRRLSQGPPAVNSTMYNGITLPTISGSLHAYWPLEDPAGTAKLANAVPQSPKMTYTGSPTLAGYEGFPGSDPVPLLSSTVLTGGVPDYPDPKQTQVRFLCYIPANGLVQGTVICSIDQVDYSAGSTQAWDLYYGNFNGNSTSFTLRTMASDGTNLGADLEHSYDVRGRLMYVSIEFEEVGTGYTRAIRIFDLVDKITYSATSTGALTQLVPVTRVRFGARSKSVVGPIGSTGLTGVAIGHVSVEDAITPMTVLGPHLTPITETAGRRIQRMCAEQGIPFENIGDLDDSVAMGTQQKTNPLAVMQECELADGGMLYESMSIAGIGYRTRTSLYNQDSQLTLDYAGFNLSEIPTPVEDDRYLQNQITVSIGDIQQTYSMTDGSLSIKPPPSGVGVYGESVSLNLANPDDALPQAAWRVHMGTVDEPRYPAISINLAHSTFATNPALKQAALALRQGDRIVVRNPPPWLPPGDIDQVILGFEETITHFEHRITFICAPASPYRTGVVDAVLAIADTDGSALTRDVTPSATTIDVAPTTSQDTLWTSDPANLPFDIRVSGEVMTVTAVSASLSDTFTRSVSSGWGSTDTGQTWTAAGGSATDYSVNGSAALHTQTSTNVSRRTTTDSTYSDFDLYMDITTSVAATGGSLYGGPVGRYLDSANLYFARVEFDTSNAVKLFLRKIVGGSESAVGSQYTLAFTHTPGNYVRVRFKVKNNNFMVKAWQVGSNEPWGWQINTKDNSIATSASVGVRSFAQTGNTNVNPSLLFDNFQIVNPQTFTVTRSVNGVVKSQAAGTDVRLASPTIIAL